MVSMRRQWGWSWLVIVSLIGYLTLQTAAKGYTTSIFSGCSNKPLQDTLYPDDLDQIYTALLLRASESSFYTMTSYGYSGSTRNKTAITGLYQCRGDLTIEQCHGCVSSAVEFSKQNCARGAAARIQLKGCYLSYGVVPSLIEAPATDFLFKTCGSNNQTGGDELRNATLRRIVRGLRNSTNGFHAGKFRYRSYLGQCQGDLSKRSCLKCVEAASASYSSQCSDSFNGQIYLNKCFISYSFDPLGIYLPSGEGNRKHVSTIIVVVGIAAAALGFLFRTI